MEVEFDHITYIAPDGINDINHLWFIAKQLPTNDYLFQEAINLSLYWINKKKLHCTYSGPFEKKLKEVQKQLFTD